MNFSKGGHATVVHMPLPVSLDLSLARSVSVVSVVSDDFSVSVLVVHS